MKKLLGVVVLLSSVSLSFCGDDLDRKVKEISKAQMSFVLTSMQKKLDGMNGEALKNMQSLLQNARCELKNLSNVQREQNAKRIQSLETFIPVVDMLIGERLEMAEVNPAKKV